MSKKEKAYSSLVSIRQLSVLWDKKHGYVKKLIQRGKIKKVVWLTKKEANDIDLQWDGKGGRAGRRPFIDIKDTAIPSEVRDRHYKADLGDIKNNGDLPMSVGDKPLFHVPVVYDSMSGEGQASSPALLPSFCEDHVENFGSMVPRVDGVKAQPPTTPSTISIFLHRDRGQDSSPPALAISTRQAEIPEKAKKIAMARLDLLRLWNEYREKTNTTPSLFSGKNNKTEADKEFIDSYNAGLLYSHIKGILSNISIRTLYYWNNVKENSFNGPDDWTCLVPQNFKTCGYPKLSQDEAATFMRFILHPNKIKIGTAVRLTQAALQNKGIESDKSPMTFRRFAEVFKREHYDRWILMREGQKALKDKVEPYIKRDPSLLEVGDCLISDGKRFDFQIINPHTGKPCRATLIGYVDWKSYDLAGYEIMVEENTQCIASALRNSIIRLGRVPKICYQDNGKAFKSRFFTSTESFEESGLYGLFGRLGVIAVFAQPYNARAKIIERWFKEFSDTFERLLPSFTGTSIDDKPAWMLRNEKFHKALHKEYVPLIEEVIQMIDTWLKFHRSQPCPHVKGKTIGEVFNEGKGPGVDVAELDDLMLAMKRTTISRAGIRFMNSDYYDDNLYGLRDAVIIRYSLFDLTKIKVYSLRGEFICVAERVMSAHPMSFYLGTAKDAEDVRQKISHIKRLEKRTIQGSRELINLGKQPDLEWQKIIEVTPNIVKKLDHTDISLPSTTVSIPECAVIQETATPPTEQPIKPFFREAYERYEYLLANGINSEEDRKWIEEYKQTNEYRLIYEELPKEREMH